MSRFAFLDRQLMTRAVLARYAGARTRAYAIRRRKGFSRRDARVRSRTRLMRERRAACEVRGADQRRFSIAAAADFRLPAADIFAAHAIACQIFADAPPPLRFSAFAACRFDTPRFSRDMLMSPC